MRQIEGKIYSHLSFDKNERHDVNEIAGSELLKVKSFEELVKRVAILSFHNKDHLLFYRGQSKEYLNRANNSSFYPSIYRTRANENLTNDMLEHRFSYLEKGCKKLIEKFDQYGIQSTNEVKKRKYIQWSILQHYEVCNTPLLDMTQSIRVACSFSFANNNSGTGYFYVFGLPYITNRISRNSEHDLVNIRLINICPPEALRPYFQEGSLVGTDDVTTDYEERSELDFKRRLIAKFKITDNVDFWESKHTMEKSLKPENDQIELLCNQIDSELKNEVSPETIFPGTWLNEYLFPDGRQGCERVEIKDGNKYYSDGRYMFNLDLVEVDHKKRKIRFRKVGIGNDKRRAINDLTIKDKNTYEGFESKANKVTYTRIG